EIVAWHVAVGDHVAEDQHLVDVMTDKATVEMTSPVAGVVVSRHGEPGEMAPVGAALVELEIEGEGNKRAEKISEAKKAETTKPSDPSLAPKEGEGKGEEAAKSAQKEGISSHKSGDKPLASPAVRRRAQELGIELQFVHGSGPAGRISHEDLDAYIASGGRVPASQYAARDGVEEIKIIGLRRKIAEKMQEAKRRIPHFAYVEEVDMTELESLRAHLNANKRTDQPKLSVLPFLIRALVRVLPDFPQVNARFDDEAGIVHRFAAIHAGIATQTPGGLIVPVLRHAEARDVWDTAAEIACIAALARDGKASRDDLTGSTITITSLGALGGVATTPVINHPEVAIIGPNAIIERPVVYNGHIAIRKMMNISSSFDHRVVDGYDAALFIQRVKAMLEHPATLFMD
ncbi:MAG TPA: dihydrolipoamide acetyltransferase family protein, partial [Rhizomicrobium sp.]|nr:dihydrolipoamide acetyltransferase family protein [Rhizomicrobium sp.]